MTDTIRCENFPDDDCDCQACTKWREEYAENAAFDRWQTEKEDAENV